MIRTIFAAALLSAAAVPVAAQDHSQHTAHAAPDYVAVLAGAHRSEANRARDAYRHPAETLSFFGFRPSMTVVEVAPGGGWYTEVLAPLIAGHGKLYAAHGIPEASEYAAKSLAGFKEKLASSPVYKEVEVTRFGKGSYDSLAPAGSADLVLTFRNVHNWYMGDFAGDAFKAFYTALKPGGVLGVVEHRLPEDRPDEAMKSSGYMKRSTIVALAEAAGFKLADESDVNANPKDTADWPKGVWTLPPNFRDGEADRAKYAAIGESDRMTLKFVKPAS
ncbi:class I SAM-dependent methyltransferase [Sphingosinicella soli]|uniref:Putative methyltransferase n=1 Tax=Sphingosinicella soli TaxID=333708 RepID=A0A7W7B4E4_9SPHN|nr:class I SAM-dependent methyltransferase [Sphingosinicella soli]MBB4633819.1 putative methyltransferase [Sphingosinicella soli]